MNLSAGIVTAGMSGELLSVCLCVSVNMRHFIFCRPLHVRKDQHVAGLAKHPGWGNLKPKVYQDARMPSTQLQSCVCSVGSKQFEIQV